MSLSVLSAVGVAALGGGVAAGAGQVLEGIDAGRPMPDGDASRVRGRG